MPNKKRFEYVQNNSGGFFVDPEWNGPDDLGGIFNKYDRRPLMYTDIYVMAEDIEEANYLIQRYSNVYFEGVSQGIDCGCCGNRWHEPWGPVED